MNPSQPDAVTRHEEELDVSAEPIEIGSVVASKRVEAQQVAHDVEVHAERTQLERIEVTQSDSGKIETLPDGSVSIPLFEEELVITKRLVVRERVIVHKQTVTEHRRIEAELRREEVDVEGDTPP
jgi:uncharacterized protein (TIGR02271 family)